MRRTLSATALWRIIVHILCISVFLLQLSGLFDDVSSLFAEDTCLQHHVVLLTLPSYFVLYDNVVLLMCPVISVVPPCRLATAVAGGIMFLGTVVHPSVRS